jgi:hypothetical protein
MTRSASRAIVIITFAALLGTVIGAGVGGASAYIWAEGNVGHVQDERYIGPARYGMLGAHLLAPVGAFVGAAWGFLFARKGSE